MLDRQYGKIIFECDACGNTLDTDTRYFNEARQRLREDDWTSRKIGSDWSHYCSCCEAKPPKEHTPEFDFE